MQDSYHKYIFDRYIKETPGVLSKIERWVNHTSNSIKIFYKDDTQAIYHGVMGTLRGIKPNNGSADDWQRDFRDALLERMSDRGYTQDSLAKAIGLSQKSLSKYLNKESIPSAYVISKMAKVLRCATDDLIYFDD